MSDWAARWGDAGEEDEEETLYEVNKNLQLSEVKIETRLCC